MKLKVYYGNLDGTNGGLVATTSLKSVLEILGKCGVRTSLYDLRQYWTETGNEADIALALSKPGTLFVGKLASREPYVERHPRAA